MTAAEKETAGIAEQHRREIVDAAERLAREKGLQALKLRDIAKACGKSLGNLYNYFQNKEAIIEAIVEREKDRFISVISQRIEPIEGESYVEKMRRELELIADAYMNPDSIRLSIFLASEAIVNPRIKKVLVETNRKVVEHIVSLIRQDPECSMCSIPLEMMEIQIAVTRAILESMRSVIIFHPDMDRDLLRRVILDRMLLIWAMDHARITGQDLFESEEFREVFRANAQIC